MQSDRDMAIRTFVWYLHIYAGHNQRMNQSPSAMQGGPPPYGGSGGGSSSQDRHHEVATSFNEGFDMFGGGSGSYQAPPNQMAPYYGGPPSYGQNMQPGHFNPQGIVCDLKNLVQYSFISLFVYLFFIAPTY